MSSPADRRGLHVGAVALVVVAAVAVAVGIASTERDVDRELRARHAAQPTPSGRARSYAELRDSARGPNAERLAAIAPGVPWGAGDGAGGEELPMSAERAARRAWPGAPPTVPHAVTQRAADCTACHAEGMVIGGKVAPRMRHLPYPVCTQCHVPMRDPRPGTAASAGPAPPASASPAVRPR